MHDNGGYSHVSGLIKVDFSLSLYAPWGWQGVLLIIVPQGPGCWSLGDPVNGRLALKASAVKKHLSTSLHIKSMLRG